ncbi:MAG: carboxylesterase family protein [Bryobacteraceae bacterium]
MKRRSFLGGATATTIFMGTGFQNPLAAAARAGSGNNPIAETVAGKVRGIQNGKISAFKGIHYGAPTTGKGRFMPASKVESWSDVKDCLDIGQRAPQLPGNLVPEYAVMERTEPMGGDCLVCNVFTPGLKDGKKRPVMFWLHGGGYAAGSGGGNAVYDGTNLAAKHDVVVVTINHRLNIFGFLYLADIGGERFANASNVGMLDVVLALQWVRDNIANFGGDPNNVTIFGQSGGGGKVSTLLGMPAAKGLFHKAIAMSGSALTGIPRDEATKTAEAVMKKLGVKEVADLQTVPMLTMLDLTRPGALGIPARWGPVTDGRTLPADPFEPVATSISADVPLMIGSTETEITWNAGQQYDPLDDNALRANIKRALRVNDAGADKVVSVYKKNRPKASNLDLYLIAGTDGSNFREGTDVEADRKAALAKAPVYKYYFQFYSPVRDGMLRSMHTMDIPFVFQNVDVASTEIGKGTELHPLADRMSGAWTSFARTGNPNHKLIPNWPAYTPQQKATIVFGNTDTKVVNDPYREEKDAIATARRDNKA